MGECEAGGPVVALRSREPPPVEARGPPNFSFLIRTNSRVVQKQRNARGCHNGRESFSNCPEAAVARHLATLHDRQMAAPRLGTCR